MNMSKTHIQRIETRRNKQNDNEKQKKHKNLEVLTI